MRKTLRERCLTAKDAAQKTLREREEGTSALFQIGMTETGETLSTFVPEGLLMLAGWLQPPEWEHPT